MLIKSFGLVWLNFNSVYSLRQNKMGSWVTDYNMTFIIQLYIHLSGVIYRLIILYQQNVKCKTFHYALTLRLNETFKSSKSFKI